MRWSKVRKLVEESFAPSVRGRVTVHSANSKQKGIPYRCSCGWGWIAVDGRSVASFDTHESLERFRTHTHEGTSNSGYPTGHPPIPDAERGPNRLVETGEFSRFDLHHACWEYLHSSVNEALASDHPLIVSLAVLNARVGKHRLRRVAQGKLHPLTRALLDFRLSAEAAAEVPAHALA